MLWKTTQGINSGLQDRVEALEDENEGLKVNLFNSGDIALAGEDAVAALELVRSSSKESQREKLVTLLPKEFVWDRDGGSIKYADVFLRDLEGLEAKLQRRIIRQVELLSTNRMGKHNSLHTRKILTNIPGVPQGWSSRGTHKHRFAWTKDGDITLDSLYQKGDSRVRESES